MLSRHDLRTNTNIVVKDDVRYTFAVCRALVAQFVIERWRLVVEFARLQMCWSCPPLNGLKNQKHFNKPNNQIHYQQRIGYNLYLIFLSIDECIFITNITTLDNGYLGSRNDEERSKMRYVMWIAKPRESSNLWTQTAVIDQTQSLHMFEHRFITILHSDNLWLHRMLCLGLSPFWGDKTGWNTVGLKSTRSIQSLLIGSPSVTFNAINCYSIVSFITQWNRHCWSLRFTFLPPQCCNGIAKLRQQLAMASPCAVASSKEA